MAQTGTAVSIYGPSCIMNRATVGPKGRDLMAAEDSIFKSSGHVTGASSFTPNTWPGKILLMSWTWRLGLYGTRGELVGYCVERF